MSAPRSAEASELLTRLADPKLGLVELMSTLDKLDALPEFDRIFSIGLSANVTTDLLGAHYRRHAYLHGLRARIDLGDFDSHIENIRRFVKAGFDNALVLSVFDGLMPSLESRVELMDADVLTSLLEKTRSELRVALSEGTSLKHIYLGLFHPLSWPESSRADIRLTEQIDSFNRMLTELASEFRNVRVLDVGAAVATVGVQNAFNPRFYFKFRAPYTGDLCGEIAKQTLLMSRGGETYFYKALVLDCDNTLWGGIVGEDLITGIRLSPHDYPGSVFWNVQNEILRLQKSGVLLCLCSKNNAADVDEVLRTHPHMTIKDEHIVLKRVNWESKVDNLRSIAKELNIGLDSLVFVDDSSFECTAVRSQLPMVKTFQVPKNTFEYPALMRQIRELFVPGGVSASDTNKTEQYRARALVEQERAKHSTQDEYLRSLGLKLEVRKNSREHVPRISELTQKSNQFNLTTHRYTEGEIEALMTSGQAAVYSFNVLDKFGDHGLTVVAIVRYRDEDLMIENFLMSCRVIGRGVEFAFWDRIVKEGAAIGCKTLKAKYVRSPKNAQVETFYDQLGLHPQDTSTDHRSYSKPICDSAFAPQGHVEVRYVY